MAEYQMVQRIICMHKPVCVLFIEDIGSEHGLYPNDFILSDPNYLLHTPEQNM